MIKSIIFSSLLHILFIFVIIFNISDSEGTKGQKVEEIKVSIVEEKIQKKPDIKKVINKNKVNKKKKGGVSKFKKRSKKIKKDKVKKQIPKKTIINKNKSKIKESPKIEEQKNAKDITNKHIEKNNIIKNIKEYGSLDRIGISIRERANLKSQITRCYKSTRKGFDKIGIDVGVNVRISRGGIINYQNMIFTNIAELSQIEPDTLQEITTNIAKTLKKCSPLRNLPQKKYNVWNKMHIKFKY